MAIFCVGKVASRYGNKSHRDKRKQRNTRVGQEQAKRYYSRVNYSWFVQRFNFKRLPVGPVAARGIN